MTRPPARAITLTLPEPPSANRWWRRAGTRMHLSEAARKYKETVALTAFIEHAAKFDAPALVSVRITWYRGRKSGDLDKRIGILLDALQGVAYDNDAQITTIEAKREDDKHRPRVEITIDIAA